MKNRRNHITKTILSIILSLSIVLGGMPVSIFADETYITEPPTESTTEGQQIGQQNKTENTGGEGTENSSGNDVAGETDGSSPDAASNGTDNSNGAEGSIQDTGNGKTANGTQGTEEEDLTNTPANTVGEGNEQTPEKKETAPAEYTDRNIDVIFNSTDHTGALTEDVIANQSVVYVGDTLTAVLNPLEGGSASDGDASIYTYEWQLQDENDPEIYYSVPNGNGMTYTPVETGVYRLRVYSPADDVNYINEYEGYFGLIIANPIPVTITWDPAEVTKVYDGKSTFSYSGTRTVTRDDDGSEITNCKETVSGQVIEIGGSDAGSYTVPMTGVGTDLSEDVYSISSNEINVNIKKAEITATITVPGKNYDGTNAVEASPTIEWTVNDTGLKKEELSLCVGDHTLGASDLVYSSSGNVEEDTRVSVTFAEEAEVRAAINGQINDNYKVKVSFPDQPIITKNVFSVSACVEYQDANAVEINGTVWVKGDTVSANAKSGYTIAASEDQEYAEKTALNVTNDGTVFYAKNADGDIALVKDPAVCRDTTAPSVDLQDTDFKIFNWKDRENTYVVTEAGSGIASVRYLVTEKEQKDVSPDDTWKEVDVDKENKCAITLTVPKKGYVYFYTKDKVGNESIECEHMLVLENSKPTIDIITGQDESKSAAVTHEVSIKATDSPEKEFSGIQQIEYKLTDAENKDVTGEFSIELTESSNASLDSSKKILYTEDPLSISEINALKEVKADLKITGKESMDGVYKLKATAFDYCGNESDPVEVELKFDYKKPEITINPVNGKRGKNNLWYFNADEGQQITVSFSDTNLMEDECKVILTGPAGQKREAVLNNPDSDKNVFTIDTNTVAISEDALKNLDEGAYSLTFYAKDKANNESDLAVLSDTASDNKEESGSESETDQVSIDEFDFIVDRTAPSVTDIIIDTDGVIKGQKYKDKNLLKFSNPFSVIVTIKDKNLDADLIKAAGAGSDDTADSSAAITIENDENNDPDVWKVTFSLSEAGELVPSIKAADFAGNKVKLAEDLRCSVPIKSNYIEVMSTVEGDSRSIDSWWEESEDGISSAKTLIYSNKKPGISLTYKKSVDNDYRLIGKENTLEPEDSEQKTAYYNNDIQVEAVLENFDEFDYELIEVAINKDGERCEEKTLKDILGNVPAAYDEPLTFTLPLKEEGKYNITFTVYDSCEKTVSLTENSPYEDGDPQKSDVMPMDEMSTEGVTTKWGLVIDRTAPTLSGMIIPDAEVSNTGLITTKVDRRYYFNNKFTYSFSITEKNLVLGNDSSTIHLFMVSKSAPSDSNDTEDGSTEKPVKKYYKEIVFDKNSDYINEKADELDIYGTENNNVFVCSEEVPAEGVYAVYAYGTDLAGNPVEIVDPINNDDQKGQNAFAFSLEEGAVTKHVTYTTVVDLLNPQYTEDSIKPTIEVKATIPTDLYCNNGEPLFAKNTGETIPFEVSVEDPVKDAGAAEGGEKKNEVRSGLQSITYALYQCSESTDPENGKVKKKATIIVFDPGTENPIWQYDVAEEKNDPVFGYQGSFEMPVVDNANRNNLVLVVKAKDRAGNEGVAEYYFGIDNAQPAVNVEFDNNDAANEKYFKGRRTATITVTERNFAADKISISVTHDGSELEIPEQESDTEKLTVSGWSERRKAEESDNGDGDTFTRTIEFKADGNYTFEISGGDAAENPVTVTYSDKDGNAAVAPNEFTIDTVKPVIEVTYDNNDVRNGVYFKENRKASIIVTERNFVGNLIDISKSIDTEGLEIPGKIVEDEDWKYVEDVKDKKHTKTVSFNGDGDYTFDISGKDAAGNDAEVKFINAKVPNAFTIDTHDPKVIVTMDKGNEYDEGFYYNEYNCGLEVSIDDHGHSIHLDGDGESEYPVYEVKVDGDVFGKLEEISSDEDSEPDPSKHIFKFVPDGKMKNLTDGTHTITINVTDVAGNPAEITFNGCKKSDNNDTEAAFILDKTAPVYSVDVSAAEATNQSLNASQGNRYYFNAAYTMTVSVEETNLDTKRIKVLRGAETGVKEDGSSKSYDSSSVIIDSFGAAVDGKTKDGDPTHGEYTQTVSQNGVYRYAIYGSDKAGNALVLKKGAADNIDGTSENVVNVSEQQGIGSLETLAELTNHIVVDTIAPVGTYEVSYDNQVYYRMDQLGQVTLAEPYRDETSAQLQVKVDTAVEMTPVRIQYSINAAPQRYSGSVDTGEYKYGNAVTSAQNGKQKFKLTSLIFTDLAGNVSNTKSDNYIHLDYDIPIVDSIAPTINIVTTATPDCRDGNGQPLFNSDVPLAITVSDPDGGQSSSGLADITYEMYVNESLVSEDTISLHGSNTKKYDKNYTDEPLMFSNTWPVNVYAASHNYNNLRVLVTATDNAGFKSTGEYRFGIDVTPPTISVTYDNNDAQNEKYFKADRTATVVVTERNFAADRISINTQTPSISGWTHASGGSANGDDDTWTATVSYTTDGNYTLAVSGSDTLGWTAGETTYNGVAPTDFVLDKTAPVISITYDNNDVRNEKYYKADRTATISVTDVNFNGANAITVNASGGGQAPGVAFSGSSASLPFTTDGIYSFSGTVTDMAGNVSAVFTEPEFVLDKTKPQISITGVENLSANKVPLNIILTMLDTNLNESSIIASLTGTNNGAVDISGKKTFISGGVQYTLDAIQVDDYYQLVFKGIDLAGNEETITISFSENQHGTTFEFVQKDVAGKYTNKTFKPQFILHNVDVVTILSVTVNGKEVDYEYKNNTLTLKDELTSDGKYVISITTKDAAGNVNTMESVEFYLDQKAPVISQKGLESTSNGNYKKVYSTPFDLTILHDIPDDAFVVVKLNGKELKPSEYTINADGSITLAIDKYQKYDIEVTVTDAAGNEASARWEFELTRNPFKLWFSNKPLFYGSLVGMLLLLFLIILLLKRRKDDEEEKEAKE